MDFYVAVAANLIVENVIQIKSGIAIRVDVSVKIQQYVMNAKKIKLRILLRVLVSVIMTKIVRLINILKSCICVKSLIDDSVITCDEIINTPETMSIDSVEGTVMQIEKALINEHLGVSNVS